MSARESTHIDQLVGHNIRIHRADAGMSQTDLGHRIGVTFQQVQKYENGVNRVGSGRLFKIAGVLSVPISTLFSGVDEADPKHIDGSPVALLAEPYALRLLQAFSQIEDAEVQRSLVEMAEAFATKLKAPARPSKVNGRKRARGKSRR